MKQNSEPFEILDLQKYVLRVLINIFMVCLILLSFFLIFDPLIMKLTNEVVVSSIFRTSFINSANINFIRKKIAVLKKFTIDCAKLTTSRKFSLIL